MKKINKTIKSVLSIMMALVFIFATGCKKEEEFKPTIVERPPVVKELSLAQTSLDLKVGSTAILVVDKYDRDSSNPIEWRSEDETIAKVDSQGRVEAIGDGTTNIVATQGSLTATCAVTSGFKGEFAQVMVSVDDEFSVQKNAEFSFAPTILFDDKTYNDGVFTYSVSDQTNFSIEDGVLVGLTTGASTDLIIEGQWRGQTSDDMVTLRKVLKVNVIDSVNLLIEEYANDYAELYTLPEFDGKTYVNTIPFTPKVYVNGEVITNPQVSVVPSDTRVVYDQTNKQIIGKEFGLSVLTISYEHNGKILAETFDINVIRPVADFEGRVNYFSAYKGTLRDENNGFADKTLVEYMYPGQTNEVLCDAYIGDTALEVVDNKVLGITGINTGTYEQTVAVGTKTSIYNVDMTVYGQYVYDAQDLDVFTRNSNSISYSGYVELGRDIDASDYQAGNHFAGETISSYYPKVDSTGKYVTLSYYTGVFDGKGHTINDLTISYADKPLNANLHGHYGMFVAIKDAEIKNLAFSNVDITGRDLFGYFAENTNFENLYIKVKNLVKWAYYNANVMTYMPVLNGTMRNIIVQVPETITIEQAKVHIAGAFVPVKVKAVATRPVFENCIVISKLPVSYSAHLVDEMSIGFAQNATDAQIKPFADHYMTKTYGSTPGTPSANWNTLVKQYKAFVTAYEAENPGQTDYDINATDGTVMIAPGRVIKYDGVYAFDSMADMYADPSMMSVLAGFDAQYWNVEDGKISWGAFQIPIGAGQIFFDLGEGFRGKDVQGLTSNLDTYQAGARIELPVLSLYGYEFKGWKNLATGETIPVANGKCVIESFDGNGTRLIAIWEETSISGPVIPL